MGKTNIVRFDIKSKYKDQQANVIPNKLGLTYSFHYKISISVVLKY